LNAVDTVAGWRLLRPLGRGGMSVVWLAERAEGGLRREVAIKLPLEAQLTHVLAERFARERDVLAALDHPHIARLFDAGVMPGGQPYIVLEYVRGLPITSATQGWSPRQRLALFRQVLSAVEHAHRHMVVHRDLKPSNILVTESGQAKLLDFGIAKLLAPSATDAADLTRDAGSSVLTPRYAAPEQVTGAPISTATDVYAAGVVLYELLAGRPPYGADAEAVAAVMHAVVHTEPKPPGVSPYIDTVLLKALRKDPQERYASIERFDEDLRRVLADEPILARRVPWWQRVRLLVRRHRRASATVALAVVLLLTTAGIAWRQTQETAAQQARGDAVRDFVSSMISDAEPVAGRSEVTGKELVDAATTRARTEFADRPRLRGELLGELGRVYVRLGHTKASVEVLEESLALLTAAPSRPDGPMNRTRAVLARALLTTDAARAAALAHQALDECPQREATACAAAREHALHALVSGASWRGDHADALRLARALVAEAEVTRGPRSAAMAPQLETLGMAARNAGELQEAMAAIERIRTLPGQERMKSINRDRLDLTEAVLKNDLGRHAEAAALLRELLRREASPDERSAQLRVLATAELGQGHPVLGLRAAEQARDVVSAGPRTAAYWLAMQALGIAESAAGQHVPAISRLAQARDALSRLGYAANSAAIQRLRRLEAEALLRSRQDDAGAASALERLLADQRSSLDAHPVDVARTLDALGCSALLASRIDEARPRFNEAARHYASRLPDQHPLRLRSQALHALAEGAPPAQATARYRQSFAADSPLRLAELSDCRAML
jgi:hypothetical protein